MDLIKVAKTVAFCEAGNWVVPGTYRGFIAVHKGTYGSREIAGGDTFFDAGAAGYDLLNPGKVPDVVVLPVALTAPWLEARKRHHAAWLNHEDDKTPAIRREIEKHADALAAALTQGGELPHADQSKD